MATYLPLFPLQLVVFPGEKLNLHVFEDKYKQLISECYNGNKTFGIPTYIKDNITEYGMEVEVLALEKVYPDGKMDIRTRGIRSFRLLEFMPKAENALYPAGIVSFEHDFSEKKTEEEIAQEEISKNLKEILIHLAGVLDITKNLIPSRPNNMSYKIAHYLGMPLEDEYELLLTHTETERQQKLIRYIKSALPDIERRELMKKRIALNGHFKDIKPPHF